VRVSERFTAASTPYKENLRHWSREVIKLTVALAVRRNADNTDTVSRGSAFKTAGCASRDKMVYCAAY
jgi:hypothetical protein